MVKKTERAAKTTKIISAFVSDGLTSASQDVQARNKILTGSTKY